MLARQEAQLGTFASRYQQVDHGQAGGVVLEDLLSGSYVAGDPHCVALGAQEVLTEVGGEVVAVCDEYGERRVKLALGAHGLPAPFREKAVSIGRLNSASNGVDNEGQLVYLVPAVEALASRCPFGHDLPIAVFPGPERLLGHTEHLGDGADPIKAVTRHELTLPRAARTVTCRKGLSRNCAY